MKAEPRNVSAVVLAAGRGARAWPYAGHRQKVTLPVLNEPLVRRLARDLAAIGIAEIAVVVGHRAAAVRSCLLDLPGVRFVEQRQQDGTADAALAGLEAVSGDDVLVCYADVLAAQSELARLVKLHGANGGQATLLAARHLPSASVGYAVELGRGGTVSGLQAVAAGESLALLYGGVVAAAREPLKRFLLKNPGVVTNVGAGGMPPLEAELCCSLDAMARETGQVGVMLSKKGVVDVDKPWQLVEANLLASTWAVEAIHEAVTVAEGASISDKAVIENGVKVVLGKGALIGDYCNIRSSVILDAGAVIGHGALVRNDGPVFLGENSTINDYCFVGGRSVIGPGTLVGHGVDFIGITFDDVSIRHPAAICAVLGSKVNIGGGTTTANWRFDNQVKSQVTRQHREKPERFGEMTYIGDYSRIGQHVMLSPGARVGSYACVGPGVYVAGDIPERKLVMQKQELVFSDWGPEVYGW